MRDKSLYGPVAARTQPTQPAVRLVSLNSALQALNHVSFYNGCGRLAEATAMLVEAQPAPVVPDLTDAELNAMWTDQDNAGRRTNFRLGYRLAQKLAAVKPSIQDLADRARAKGIVAVAQDAPVVPATHVLVPIEPTPEMKWAAVVLADREWCYHVGRDDAKKLWAAMLAAAPQPLPLPPPNVGAKLETTASALE